LNHQSYSVSFDYENVQQKDQYKFMIDCVSENVQQISEYILLGPSLASNHILKLIQIDSLQSKTADLPHAFNPGSLTGVLQVTYCQVESRSQ
jgi:hypothetical protein